MLLTDLVTTSRTVAESSSRRAKAAALADLLRRLRPDEVVPAVAFLSGELRQRQIGVGWATLRDVAAHPAPTAQPRPAALTLAEVDATFAQVGAVSGAGSQRVRRGLLADLLDRATGPERQFLVGLLSGELRQGALEGVMADAVAQAAAVPPQAIRRALLLRGDLRAVAEVALRDGAVGLAALGLQIGRPLQPMLAQPVPDLDSAVDGSGPVGLEEKLDGVRIQVHRSAGTVAVFTRSLDDITDRVPELVTLVLALRGGDLVLDGEALTWRADGRPQPFQVTAGRVGSRTGSTGDSDGLPLQPAFFDVLHADGVDLLDRPAVERMAVLSELVPERLRVRRLVTDDIEDARRFLAETLRRGHEGVVVKALDAGYEAGRRGTGWLKVKPRHTLDLVVLAAEWGHGRRQGWLSNLHLGARDPAGGFAMLGKTFKGMTDDTLRWQTERLRELAASPLEQWVVTVRPELVVEVAFDGVQRSPRYPAGLALRFARIVRYRPDRSAADADTIDAVRAIHLAAGGAAGTVSHPEL
ncbi:MAG: ATP-dependent DNA ligase [Actinobacteria bacterium]|nr:ATP-dependent DNA ligase [Actinomycetota bacterium]